MRCPLPVVTRNASQKRPQMWAWAGHARVRAWLPAETRALLAVCEPYRNGLRRPWVR